MKKTINISIPLAFLLFLFPFCHSVFGQTEQQKVSAIIFHRDSLFWESYNACETEKMRQYLTEDVEFYHDKGGVTLGRENLVASLKKNLCSNEDFRLRRETVEGSVKVFPLQNNGISYGAIISGEHIFYIYGKNKKERLDGLAKFTQLWMLKDSVWKMSRILSYNHGPAPYINKRKEIKLSEAILNQYIGKYEAAKTGTIIVQLEQNSLILQIGTNKYFIYPATENTFFSKERDLTFEFLKNDQNKPAKMIVREYGEIAEEAVFSK